MIDCRAVCQVCLGPVLMVSGGSGPVMVDPEQLPAEPAGPANVLVRRATGAAVVLSEWESARTVIDQGSTARYRMHRCETVGMRFRHSALNVVGLDARR